MSPNGGPEVGQDSRVDDAELVVVPGPLNDAAVVGKEEEVEQKLP